MEMQDVEKLTAMLLIGALRGEEGSGIAYAAHIGGFIAGLVLVKLFARPARLAIEKRGIV